MNLFDMYIESILEHPFPDSVIKNEVYHVSDNLFEEFDETRIGSYSKTTSIEGFYFSDSPVNMRGGKFIYKCYVDIRKPIIVDMNKTHLDSGSVQWMIDGLIRVGSTTDYVDYLVESESFDEESADRMAEDMKKNADSAIFLNSVYGNHKTEYVLFNNISAKRLNDRIHIVEIIERK